MMEKIIFITGAGSAFGQLAARTLSNKGHQVIATMRDIQGRHLDVAEKLSSLDQIDVAELDVTDDHSVKSAIAATLEKYGKIDVLINNAAIQGAGLTEAYSHDQFHKIIDTNLYGVLRVFREVLPAMRKRKEGLIINISSSAGRFSAPYQVPYNTSRFALEGLVEGIHQELIVQGIENILIEPGPYLGGMYDSQVADADLREVLSSYGEDTEVLMAGYSTRLGKAIQRYQPDMRSIVESINALIEMERGTRPLRTPLDSIAQGIDLKYDQLSTSLRKDWMLNYLE